MKSPRYVIVGWYNWKCQIEILSLLGGLLSTSTEQFKTNIADGILRPPNKSIKV